MREIFRSNPYGWLVVAVSFVALSLVFSTRSSLGLLMPVWEQELGWSRSFVSSGGAVMLLVMAALAPVAGYLVDRHGPRLLYAVGLTMVGLALAATSTMTVKWHFLASFAVLGGIGFSVIAVPLVATAVTPYFDKHRGLATGLATAGVSGGQLMVLPLLAALVAAWGWRNTYLGFGAVMLVLAPVTFMLIRAGVPTRTSGARPADEAMPLAAKLRTLAASRSFWLLAGAYTICGFTTTGVIKVHLLPYAAACGYPPLQSTAAYGVLSAFNVVGMIGAGWLCDRMHRPLLLALIYFVRALSFILLMYIAADLSLLFIFAVIFGLFDFATVPVISHIVVSHIGVRMMGLTLGILFALHSVGGAAGAFLGGTLFDLFNHYDWVWVAALALATLAGVLSLFIPAHPATPPATPETPTGERGTPSPTAAALLSA
jgi:MFS family permease